MISCLHDAKRLIHGIIQSTNRPLNEQIMYQQESDRLQSGQALDIWFKTAAEDGFHASSDACMKVCKIAQRSSGSQPKASNSDASCHQSIGKALGRSDMV